MVDNGNMGRIRTYTGQKTTGLSIRRDSHLASSPKQRSNRNLHCCMQLLSGIESHTEKRSTADSLPRSDRLSYHFDKQNEKDSNPQSGAY